MRFCSLEIFHQHQVAAGFVELGVQEVSPVGRVREAHHTERLIGAIVRIEPVERSLNRM